MAPTRILILRPRAEGALALRTRASCHPGRADSTLSECLRVRGLPAGRGIYELYALGGQALAQRIQVIDDYPQVACRRALVLATLLSRGVVAPSRLMKNGVRPDSIGAGSLRASFFLARKKARGMVERFFSTLLDHRNLSPRPELPRMPLLRRLSTLCRRWRTSPGPWASPFLRNTPVILAVHNGTGAFTRSSQFSDALRPVSLNEDVGPMLDGRNHRQ